MSSPFQLAPQWKDRLVRRFFSFAASFTILIVVLIFLFVAREAAPFLKEPGFSNLLGSRWIPAREAFGILPLVMGSLLVTALATVIAVPLGVAGAVYIAEVARPIEREILKPFIEVLAAIPSVVLGFFGFIVMGPVVKSFFQLESGLTALTGALVLALMALPTVISVSEDAIRSVPDSFKQASLALGATSQQTVWRVIVPAAIPGITAAVMLGIGRIVGEAMAVMMVTGNAAQRTLNPFESVSTMTATIALEMGDVVFGSPHYHALFCVGCILLLSTFLLNVLALKAFKRYGGRR